jgi:hypothetical protein
LQLNEREIAGRHRMTRLVEIARQSDPDLSNLKIDQHLQRSFKWGISERDVITARDQGVNGRSHSA